MEAGKVGRDNEEGAVDGRGDSRDSTVQSQPEREDAPILKESKFKVYLLLERLSDYSLPCLLGKLQVLIPHEDLVWNMQDEETIRTTSQVQICDYVMYGRTYMRNRRARDVRRAAARAANAGAEGAAVTTDMQQGLDAIGQRWNQQVCNAGLLELPSYPPYKLCLGRAQDVGNLEEIEQETA